VYVLAEILKPRDFVYETSLEKVFADTLSKLQSQPTLIAFAPDDQEWQQTPEASKLLISYLLARLTNEELIDLSQEEAQIKFRG
jgi:hypothetical protein